MGFPVCFYSEELKFYPPPQLKISNGKHCCYFSLLLEILATTTRRHCNLGFLSCSILHFHFFHLQESPSWYQGSRLVLSSPILALFENFCFYLTLGCNSYVGSEVKEMVDELIFSFSEKKLLTGSADVKSWCNAYPWPSPYEILLILQNSTHMSFLLSRLH